MARPGSSKREAIVAAAKALLWERGYEATSPRDVLDRSGAGQGSLYHHFSGKREVAAAALAEMAEEEIAVIDALFSPDTPPLDRVGAYLTRERQALRGCRLARLANEAAMEEPALREPVAAYLGHIEASLRASLEEAKAGADLLPGIEPAPWPPPCWRSSRAATCSPACTGMRRRCARRSTAACSCSPP